MLTILDPTFQLDEDQPLEYLSEHRDVTILFINLVLESAHDHGACLQRIQEVIGAAVLQFQGIVKREFAIGKVNVQHKRQREKSTENHQSFWCNDEVQKLPIALYSYCVYVVFQHNM